MKKVKSSGRRKSGHKEVQKKQSLNQDHLITILLILVIIFISAVRLRLLNVPMERDEGEYAYFAQLLLSGIPPYEMAYSMKFPGVYFIYAFFMLFLGQNIPAVHITLLVANLVTIIFLFLLVKELINSFAALAAAASYGILTLDDAMLGFAAHATHFVVLAAIPGFYFLLKAFKSSKPMYYLVAGVLLGMAPLFKQSGVFFSVAGAMMCILFFINQRKKIQKKVPVLLILFIAGGFIPFILTFTYLLVSGVFESFWFWTIQYPFAYGGQVTFGKGMEYLTENFGEIISGFGLLWILIGAGAFLMFFTKFRESRILSVGFLVVLLIFSALTTVPGFYFRNHYFVSLMPVMAILSGVTINFFATLNIGPQRISWQKPAVFMVLVIAFAMGIAQNKAYYFSEKPDEVSRRIYGLNPFVESKAIGEFIHRKTNEGDKIAIFGSEPQIYFFAERKSATGFIYMYPMMEDHEFNLQMQEQMISEIEAADPEILIFVDISTSWLKKPTSPTKIFSWSRNRSESADYELVGTTEVFSDATLYKFTDVAMKNQPVSKYRVRIYKKTS
jgi:4-amino-4-deoxy-L-arabinose transferase-like glycosyltransferase